MNIDTRVDDAITQMPSWQQAMAQTVRRLVHAADADVQETIKRTNRPYFTLDGNVCAFLSAKDHLNVFIYDPIAPDPKGLINQGQNNATARAIQLYERDSVDEVALIQLFKEVIKNNRAGGWRNLLKQKG